LEDHHPYSEGTERCLSLTWHTSCVPHISI
jgi:hypothetical protein